MNTENIENTEPEDDEPTTDVLDWLDLSSHRPNQVGDDDDIYI